jgi:formate transporter FocA
MSDASPPPQLDALLPPAMATRAEEVGVRKAGMSAVTMFVLAVLAGAFIALGAVFATTVVAGAGTGLPYGVARLLAGTVFSLGLILVIVGGAELFTGNNLIIMAWASRRVGTIALVRNWVIVYAGNFVGAVATAALVFVSGQYAFGGGSIGAAALGIADAKVALAPLQAVALGILCNGLVCLAVWLAFSARSTVDRVVVIVPPIAAFVAAGFEHSVANMYFIPIGILIAGFAPESFWTASGLDQSAYANLTVEAFLANLVPVTIGNIVGGTLLVGAVYWFVYLRSARSAG